MGFPTDSTVYSKREALIADGKDLLDSVEDAYKILLEARDEAAAAAASDAAAAADRVSDAEKSYLEAVEQAKMVFFNRDEKEVLGLLESLQRNPEVPIVVRGQKGSGKTSLLRHLEQIYDKETSFLLFDLTESDYETPDAFAEAIKARLIGFMDRAFEAKSLWDYFKVIKHTVLGTSFRWAMEQCFGLTEVISCFKSFIEPRPRFRAILIVDGAEMLKPWEGEFPAELGELMGFFSWLPQRSTRVLISTSDETWPDRDEQIRYEEFALGNLGENEAKEFFEKHCFIGIQQPREPWQGKWSEIYRSTGGLPGELKMAAERSF